MLCMHDSGTHNSNAAHVAARINHEDDDYDDDVEQFFFFLICTAVQRSRRRGSRGREKMKLDYFYFFNIYFVLILKFEKRRQD